MACMGGVEQTTRFCPHPTHDEEMPRQQPPTQHAVHVDECHVMVMQTTVLEEAPELHAVHHEGVVRTLLVAQGAVEVVDLAQVRHVTDDDKDRLRQTGLWLCFQHMADFRQ